MTIVFQTVPFEGPSRVRKTHRGFLTLSATLSGILVQHREVIPISPLIKISLSLPLPARTDSSSKGITVLSLWIFHFPHHNALWRPLVHLYSQLPSTVASYSTLILSHLSMTATYVWSHRLFRLISIR